MPHPLRKLKFSLLLRLVGIYKHMTLGARVAVIVEGRVLLVKHGYVAGWHLPGGGVDPGETVEAAGRREVEEETGHLIAGPMELFSIYHSTLYTNRDHVALFIARDAQQAAPFVANREIKEIGWFPLDRPPMDLSPATGRRLTEIAGAAPIAPNW